MIVGTRLAVVLFAVTAGGLLLTTSRYKSTSQPQPIALDILEHAADEQSPNLGRDDYNYCQAPRPALTTYPGPKVEPCSHSFLHSSLIAPATIAVAYAGDNPS